MYVRHCWLCFFSGTVPRIVEFTGHLSSDDMLLAVREWKREKMGITKGNEKGIEIK